MIYAADTSTSVEKTRAELETVIGKFGAEAFGYAMDNGKAAIQFKARGKFVRFILPLPRADDKRFTMYSLRGCPKMRTADAARKDWEQACRSSWRALFLAVKAKLVAVEAGITTFEQEFGMNIVLPDGKTVGEHMVPQIEEAYKTGVNPVGVLQLCHAGSAS